MKNNTTKGTKGTTKREIRQQAASVAEFIENAPPIIRDGLESFLENVDNSFQVTTIRNGKDGLHVDRAGLTEFLELAQARDLRHTSGGFYTGNQEPQGSTHADTPQPFIRYAPEIEARRADYKRLAESFAQMIELETKGAAGGILDIAAPGVMEDEHNSSILIGGIRDHFDALFQDIHAGLIYEEDFLHIIYPELRLWHDHKMLAHRMGEFKHLRAGESLAHRHTRDAKVKINGDIYAPLGLKRGDTVYYCLECQPQEGEIAVACTTQPDLKFYIGRVHTTSEGVELLVADLGTERDVFTLSDLGAKIIGKAFEAEGATGGRRALN